MSATALVGEATRETVATEVTEVTKTRWVLSRAMRLAPSLLLTAHDRKSLIHRAPTRRGGPRRMRLRAGARTLAGMSTFRLRSPDRTLDLGEFDNAQEALEAAVSRQAADGPADGTLEVEVGGSWHPVDIEGGMP